MAICNECKNFFKDQEDESIGDCIQRVVDPRQAYYQAKPVEAEQDSSDCSAFQKK